MRRLLVHAFESERSLAEMLTRLNAQGPWPWTERDKEQWGEYLATRGLTDSIVKLFEDGNLYGIYLKFELADDDADARFEALLETLLTRVLPSIEARNVRADETD